MIYIRFTVTKDTKYDATNHTFDKVTPYQYECLGSDSIIIVDARLSLSNIIDIANYNLPKRLKKYNGYKIYKAEKFSSTNQKLMFELK